MASRPRGHAARLEQPARITVSKSMTQPVFVEHRGRKILRLDYSGMPLSQVITAMHDNMKVIASQPPNSVLALTLWSAPLTQEAAEIFRRHVAQNTPYIRGSAVVAPRPLQRVFFENIMVDWRGRLHGRLEAFEDEQQAMDWLADLGDVDGP